MNKFDDLDKFLATELNKLPEFQTGKIAVQSGHRSPHTAGPVLPDANGFIYEICGLCGIILDCVSEFSDAENLVDREHHSWSFCQIWQINVETKKRFLMSQKEIKKQPANPLRLAALVRHFQPTKGTA